MVKYGLKMVRNDLKIVGHGLKMIKHGLDTNPLSPQKRFMSYSHDQAPS